MELPVKFKEQMKELKKDKDNLNERLREANIWIGYTKLDKKEVV